MNFDKEAKSDTKNFGEGRWGGGGGGVPGTETKTVCQTESNEVNTGPPLLLQIFIKIFWHNHIIIF